MIRNIWLLRQIFFIRAHQKTDTFEIRYFTCSSPIYRSAGNRNRCTISTSLIIDVMQIYGKINLTKRIASSRHFHFRSEDTLPLIGEITTVSIPGSRVLPLQCKRNRKVVSPGNFMARVYAGVTSALVSRFVHFNDVRTGHCNHTAKQSLA